jgi:pimeloyl-[acyl-carrier protein] synthase
VSATLDTFDPAFLADPYPIYAELRAARPVAQVHETFWRVVRYADVAAVLRHAGASAVRPPTAAAFADGNPDVRRAAEAVDEHFSTWMLMLDPPDHTRLRALVGKAFTPRVVEGLRTRIESIVAELLTGARPGAELDLIETLAEPLPTRVIAELIGVPAADARLLKAWSNDIAAVVGIGTLAPNRDELFLRGAESIASFSAYLHEQIEEHRSERRDDLLGRLVEVEEDGSKLSADELIGTVVLLLVAGHETTTNLIGNGMLALLRDPDERLRLRADPTLLPTAIEEFLRYDSPVQGTLRTLKQPLETSTGDVIGAGCAVGIWIGSANRDEAVFTDADRLDVGRQHGRHLSFAHGPHYCLGAALARLEAHCAFTRLLYRLEDVGLVREPERRPNPSLRGVTTLAVRFGGRARAIA